MKWSKARIFAGGVLFGTAGIRLLSGRDAKKAYTHCVAAVLRVRDAVTDRAAILQENCMDIYEGAKQINAERAKEEQEAEIREETGEA